MLGPYTPGRGLGDRLRKVTRLQRPLTRRFPLLKAPTQTLTRNWKSLTVSIHRLRKCLRNSWLRRELTQAYATLKNTGFEATCLGSLWPLAGAIFPAVQLSQVVQVVRADDERVPSLRTGSLSLVYPRCMFYMLTFALHSPQWLNKGPTSAQHPLKLGLA